MQHCPWIVASWKESNLYSWSSLQTACLGLVIYAGIFFGNSVKWSQVVISCFSTGGGPPWKRFATWLCQRQTKWELSVISEKEIPLPAFIKVKEPFINPLWSIWLTNSWCFDHIFFHDAVGMIQWWFSYLNKTSLFLAEVETDVFLWKTQLFQDLQFMFKSSPFGWSTCFGWETAVSFVFLNFISKNRNLKLSHICFLGECVLWQWDLTENNRVL